MSQPDGKRGHVRNEPITEWGYEHWTGEPLDDRHHLALVPQSAVDAWHGYCSCGNWMAAVSFWDLPTRDEILACIKELHAEHVAEVGNGRE